MKCTMRHSLRDLRAIGCGAVLIGLFLAQSMRAELGISSWDLQGNIDWTNAFPAGVCTVESASALSKPRITWTVQQNYFTTNRTGHGQLSRGPTNLFFRLRAVDVSTNSAQGFTNFVQSFGKLHTVAGNGFGGIDGVNYWQPAFEGGYATNAALSRPHFAMATAAGAVLIVDKDSHSVLKVTPACPSASNANGNADPTTLVTKVEPA